MAIQIAGTNMVKEPNAIRKLEVKLLVVDDREDNLLSIESILSKDGYIIKTANSGRAALKLLLKEQDFILILMDVQMPDLNGFETAAMIYEREKLKHIPIIFITANDSGEESIFRGYKTGGIEYIYKPINPELLRAKVSVFVELYRKNHALIAQEQKLIATNKNLEKEITERKKNEETVEKLNTQLLDNIHELKTINEELERFAYITSHDLQEPLRKIIIFGNMLESKFKDILNNEGQEYLRKMIKASGKMQNLIKNILEFSRSSNKTGVDVFEESDLNKLIENVVADMEEYISQKNASIKVSKLPSLKVIPYQFRQLVQNLINNSLKFSKNDVSPEITIFSENIKGKNIEGIKPELYDSDFCRINIKDNGIGFEQKYAHQIFIVFKRLHAFDRIEGTGIGLSICKKIVEKHNGYINALGEVNKGATFMISIPYDYIRAEQ